MSRYVVLINICIANYEIYGEPGHLYMCIISFSCDEKALPCL